MKKMGFEGLDKLYEFRKKQLHNQYLHKLSSLEHLDEKSKGKKKIIFDKWYKRRLKSINKRLERAVKNKIFVSTLKFKLGHIGLDFDKKINSIIGYLDRYMPIITLIPRFLIHLLSFLIKSLLFLIYYILYPVVFLFKLLFPYFVSRYLSLYVYEIVRFLKLLFRGKKPYIYEELAGPNKIKKYKLIFSEEAKNFLDKKVGIIAKDTFCKINPSDSIRDAIKIMKQKEQEIVLVMIEKEIIGIVDQTDIIKQDIRNNLLTKRIDSMMQTDIIKIPAETKLQDAMTNMIHNDKRILIIGMKPPYKVLFIENILNQVNLFYERYKIDTIHMKKIKQVITKDLVVIKKTEKIQYARTLMNQHKVNFLVVVDDKKPVGVFTATNYMYELEKGVDRVMDALIVHVMEVNMPYINTYDDLFTANQKIISKGKQVVKFEQEIYGVLSKFQLLKELYDFFYNTANLK